MITMYQHGGDIYKHKNMLDFSANINMLGIPKSVVLAACEGVAVSQHYPDPQCVNLRQALSEQEEIPMEQIICGNGAAELIISLILAKRPKKALLPVPSFHEYEQALHIVDCKILHHYMEEKDGFLLQEDFLQEIKTDVDIIFLCNPNNPTGSLIEPEFMKKILRKCEEQDVLLVVDECFIDFTQESKDYSIKGQCEKTENLFVLKAFTKLYAMPGLRLGYGLSSNLELLQKMKEVSQPWSVSIPAQMAGVAALKETNYVKQSKELLRKEKAYLISELEKLNIKTYASKANYIFFHTGIGLYKRCYEKGILIRDCSNYEGLGEGYYRIAVKTHEENAQLLEVLKGRQ